MDQQGYLKNRYIGFNIRQIQDIIDYTEKLNIRGCVLFLDFRKAFDTVSWNFMFAVLKKFGFNQPFIDWIKTIYKNCSSSIMNNGWRSNFFTLYRGLRQGCPSSALLYVLVAEVMAFNIRNNINIQGIKVNMNNTVKNIKLTQLADDTTLFLGAKNEINIALNIIENFGKHSGLVLNRNKTQGLWVGRLKLCQEKIGNITWSSHPIKALGLYFGCNKIECSKLNWENKLSECETSIKNWLKRNLTFIGKIKVIKTLILSKFVYLVQSLKVPQDVIKK